MRTLTLSMKEALFLTVLFIPVAVKMWSISLLGGLFVLFVALLYMLNTFVLKREKEAIQSNLTRIKHDIQLLSMDDLQQMDGRQFELLLEKFFKLKGYKVSVTQASNDEGKDLILEDDKGDMFYIEAKRFQIGDNVGRPIAQKLYGAMCADKINYGMIVTTSDFTSQCLSWCENVNIYCMNGKELVNEIKALA